MSKLAPNTWMNRSQDDDDIGDDVEVLVESATERVRPGHHRAH